MLRRLLLAVPLILAGLLLCAGPLTSATTPPPPPEAASAASVNDLCALTAVAPAIWPALAGIAEPGETPNAAGNRIAKALDCSAPTKRSAAYEARACTALTVAGIRKLGDSLGAQAVADPAAVEAARQALPCDR